MHDMKHWHSNENEKGKGANGTSKVFGKERNPHQLSIGISLE